MFAQVSSLDLARVADRRPRWLLSSVRGYKKAWLLPDIFAGITVAAITVPEDMGYARIAGMPVEAGLYCALVPLLVFVLLGSSRQLNVGADSATAAVIGAGVAELATQGTPEYQGLVGLLALMIGALLILAGVARLGMLADLMSRPVLIGFLAGVGIQIAVKQIPGMLGFEVSGGFFESLDDIVRGIPHANVDSALVAGGTIAVILLLERVSRRMPAMLVATVAAMVVVAVLDLSAHGVSVVGTVPPGLPPFGFPDAQLSDVPSLFSTAVAVAFVVLAQASATARSFATRNGYTVDTNRDLIALGVANLGGGMTAAFPVNGSVSRTAAADGAGGRTQVVGLVSLLFILLVLLFATGLLEQVPNPALDAIIFLVVLRLIHLADLRAIARSGRRWELMVALVTMAAVPVLGVKQGIVIAILLALIGALRRSYRPEDGVLVRQENGGWEIERPTEGRESAPGVIVYGVRSSLIFYNATYVADHIKTMVDGAPSPTRWLIVHLAAAQDVDYTSGHTLLLLADDLAARGVRMGVATPSPAVLEHLRHYGLIDRIGEDAVFATPVDAIVRHAEDLLQEERD